MTASEERSSSSVRLRLLLCLLGVSRCEAQPLGGVGGVHVTVSPEIVLIPSSLQAHFGVYDAAGHPRQRRSAKTSCLLRLNCAGGLQAAGTQF